MLPDHDLYRILKDLQIIDPNCVKEYAPRVRDRSDISVYRCSKSGVIFLGKIDQAELSYYVDKDVDAQNLTCEEKQIPFHHIDNARRRAEAFASMIEGKQWLDFGCGDGALLEMLGSRAQEAWGVEPNSRHLNTADGGCVQIVPSLDELSSKCFDIITLFHVYEHLAEPVKMAETLKSLLNDGGTLLIEVPHARDVLLETFDSAGFRRFTLWSEHLVLHTRESLEKFLRAAGFDDVSIFGFQRFPLSNHLYWLRNNEPGGHEKWDFLDTPELSAAYFEALEKVDQTDSLIAIARS